MPGSKEGFQVKDPGGSFQEWVLRKDSKRFRVPKFQVKVPRGSEVPSRFRKVPKVQSRVPSKGLRRFQVRVPRYVRVPSKGSGLRVLSKFQVKILEGSEVPSKESKQRMHAVPRFQAKGFKIFK